MSLPRFSMVPRLFQFLACLSWRAHIAYPCARGDLLFHQSIAWCHGDGLPLTLLSLSLSLSVFVACVLSSASFGLEHVGDDLLRVGVVNYLSGVAHLQSCVCGRAFSGRLSAVVQNGPRSPVPVSIFGLCSKGRPSFSLSVSHIGDFGVSPGSPPSSVTRLFSHRVGTHRTMAHDLHGIRVWLPIISHLPSAILGSCSMGP